MTAVVDVAREEWTYAPSSKPQLETFGLTEATLARSDRWSKRLDGLRGRLLQVTLAITALTAFGWVIMTIVDGTFNGGQIIVAFLGTALSPRRSSCCSSSRLCCHR